jgi:uncharacterized protein YunC (DUF1805 family)
MGLQKSGIAGLAILQDAGISALNDLAQSCGVRVGMRASSAARLILEGRR